MKESARQSLKRGILGTGVAVLLLVPISDASGVSDSVAGRLDKSFSGDGIAHLTTYYNPSGVAGGSNGEIVQGLSNDSVVRYSANGHVDKSLGGDGVASTRINGTQLNPEDVLVDRNDRIVVLGSKRDKSTGYNYWMGIGRLKADGTIDRSFGDNGLSLRGFGRTVTPQELAFYPGGKIVAVGWSESKGGVAVRYSRDGHLDRTFADGGIAHLSQADGFEDVRSVAIDRHGRLVIGVSYMPVNGKRMGVVRLLPDGGFDRTFSGNGVASFYMPSSSRSKVSDLTVDRRGRIVAIASEGGSWIVRITRDGQLDRTFAKDGVNGPNWSFHAFSISVDKRGRLLVLGYDQPEESYRTFAHIDRLKANGRDDYSFKFNHFYYSDFRLGPIKDHFVDVKGRIVAGGSSGKGGAAVFRVRNP